MFVFWGKRRECSGESEPPQGQSLLELVLLLLVMGALLMMLVVIGNIGIVGLKTSQAARFSAFDCDNRPGFCRAQSSNPVQKIRSAVFYSDDKEVFPFDAPSWKSVDSLGAQRVLMHRPEDVSLSLDLPRVDGADQGLLSKLSDLFQFKYEGGPRYFWATNTRSSCAINSLHGFVGCAYSFSIPTHSPVDDFKPHRIDLG